MHVNVAFGILLGFAVLEMLLLQAAVLVDGYAHAITKPAVLPTMAGEGCGGVHGKRNEGNHVCNVGGELTCATSEFCLVDEAGYIECCPDGAGCRPPTTCVPSTNLESTPCNAVSGCLVCDKPPFVECARQYNDEFTITNIRCGTSPLDFSMSLKGPLVPDIGTWSHITVLLTLPVGSSETPAPSEPSSTMPSETSAPSKPAATTSDATESEALSIIPPHTWTLVRTATGDPSSSGASVSLTTVTITGQPTWPALSTANATPNPSTAANNESSGSDTGMKVGAAVGVISMCVLAAAGAWFVYRRRLNTRRTHQNAPWQAPNAGPHHYPDAVELDVVGAGRAEMDHSPAPLPEMDPSPRPSELASPPVSPLPVGGGGGSPAIGGSRSPVSPLEGHSPVSETAPAGDPPTAVSGRYGPGGFLNPEYALRDGLFFAEDDRQVAKSTLF